MVLSSKKPKYHVRSVSFPTKSNPVADRIGEELSKLRHREASASSAADRISVGLSGVGDLYRCIEEVLEGSRDDHRRLVDDHLEGSLKLLDVCGAARDLVAQLRAAMGDLQSALRRRKDVESVEALVADYTRSRKDTIKGAKAALSGLRKMTFDVIDDRSHQLSAVLRCVGVMNVSVYESLLGLLAAPVKRPRCSGGWARVAKLVAAHKGEGEEEISEISKADIALHGLVCGCGGGSGQFAAAKGGVEALEAALEGLEGGLNVLFRQLIKTRASLLNILSF